MEFILVVTLIMIGNILWRWMKDILKQNEYQLSSSKKDSKHISSFVKLIRNEESAKLKEKYGVIMAGTVVSFLAAIAIIIVF